MENTVERAQAEVAESFEGAFYREELQRLRIEPDWPPGELYRFLTLSLRRDPSDPAFHALRLLLALEQGWHERLYGILVDLFLGLGRHGEGLKRSLLERATPHLAGEVRELLWSRLENGGDLPWGAFSVLHPGHLGRTGPEVVPSERGTAGEGEDPLLIARLCLEAGQLEEAIEVLEEALAREPEREELRLELEQLRREAKRSA